MSPSLLRVALLGFLLSLESFARPTFAQIPVFSAEPDSELTTEPAAASAPKAEPTSRAAGALAETLPVAPAPAKADVITKPARGEAVDYADDETSEPVPRRGWYGWQTLIVDGASLSTVILSAALSSGDGAAPAGLGLLGYEFGPGIVHFVHRNPGRGFASMGLRLGMPLAGAFIGASAASNCDGFLCEAGGAGAGFLVGMAGAMAIDAAVFAYDERPARKPRTASLFPVVSWRPGRAWLGIGGSL